MSSIIKHLKVWTEIVGKLSRISCDDGFIHLIIDGKILSYSIHSEEAKHLLKAIDDCLLGKTIGILRTDLPDKPILIRLTK